MKAQSQYPVVSGMAPKPTNDQSTYRKLDKAVTPKTSNDYTRYDGTVLTKKQRQDYDIYHATKGKSNKK